MTSNPERTLRLSQSGLLFSAILQECSFPCTRFTLGLHSRQISVLVTMSSTSSDSEMTFDLEDSKIYYIAEDTGGEVGFKTMTTKLIYWLVFC